MRMPIDFRRAERAYGAFYNEQPQIFFTDLSHSAQMRWVNAIRAADLEAKPRSNGRTWSPSQRKKFMATTRAKSSHKHPNGKGD